MAVKREHEEREVLQAKLTDRERELKEVQEQLEALKKSDMEVLPTHTVGMSSDPHKHSCLSVCVQICYIYNVHVHIHVYTCSFLHHRFL